MALIDIDICALCGKAARFCGHDKMVASNCVEKFLCSMASMRAIMVWPFIRGKSSGCGLAAEPASQPAIAAITITIAPSAGTHFSDSSGLPRKMSGVAWTATAMAAAAAMASGRSISRQPAINIPAMKGITIRSSGALASIACVKEMFLRLQVAMPIVVVPNLVRDKCLEQQHFKPVLHGGSLLLSFFHEQRFVGII